MYLYTIPENHYYSKGTKFPALKPKVIGFNFVFKLHPSAFYRAESTDIQKIGGVTLDPLKQQIIRLGYRCSSHGGDQLPPGNAELHAYLSLNGRYVVAPRKLGIVLENIEYDGSVIFNELTKKVTFTINGIYKKQTVKTYDFNCSPFSMFGVGGYMQYFYFEDADLPAPHQMDCSVLISPIYGNTPLAPMTNLKRSAMGILKTPAQWLNIL